MPTRSARIIYEPKHLCAILLAAGPLRSVQRRESKSPARKAAVRPDWRFFPGDPSGAESPGFEAGGWLDLDLPHDWSIEGKIDPKNPMGGSGGFFPVGIGWYRRNLMSGSPICAM
jgi:beta-galactosidase